MTIEDDLRFLSHHDMMRVMERIFARAKLPLRYSRGFNPRPVLSLPVPRPVGVASRDERVVFTLVRGIDEAELLQRLNEQSPAGMRFISARQLATGESLQPRRVAYEEPVSTDHIEGVRRRLDELTEREAWPIERAAKTKGRRRGRSDEAKTGKTRTIDLRPRVAELTCRTDRLSFVCLPQDQTWARPGEVLALVGLGRPEDLAKLVRTGIEDDM